MVRRDVGAAFIPDIKKAPSPFSADADVVDLIFGMSITGNPRDFVHWPMGEERTPDHHVVIATKFCKQLTVLAHFAETMASHDTLIVRVVGADLRIEVASVDLDVTLWNLIHDGIQLTVKVLLVL